MVLARTKRDLGPSISTLARAACCSGTVHVKRLGLHQGEDKSMTWLVTSSGPQVGMAFSKGDEVRMH